MIVYVAQAYSKYGQVPRDAYDMHEAYALAINTYWTLTKMGFEVFSPIMYTHPFHLAMKHPNIDYVAHDLKMLESWLKHDSTTDYDHMECCSGPHNTESKLCAEYEDCSQCPLSYDSGVVCVFADDCFGASELSELDTIKYYAYTDNEDDSFWWSSKGAKQEYDFAHAHHIKCIRLSELLEKHKIEECEAF